MMRFFLEISTIEVFLGPDIALRIEYSPGIRGGISEFLQKFSRFPIVLQGLDKIDQLSRPIGKIYIFGPKFRRKNLRKISCFWGLFS